MANRRLFLCRHPVVLACLAVVPFTAAAQHTGNDDAIAPPPAQKKQLMTPSARLEVDLQLFTFDRVVVFANGDKRGARLPHTCCERHFRS